MNILHIYSDFMMVFNYKNINIDKVNLVKNSIQYLIGVMLYFMVFNKLSFSFILGLLGFLIAYHSVYQFNDLMDYEEDKNNKFKLKTKLLPRGEIKRSTVESYSFMLAVIGLTLSFLVNTFFGLLVSTCLLLNFLYSSSLTRLKKSKFLLPNIFIIEFIKYSLGWFALTNSILEYPFVFIATLSMAYLIGFTYWKQDISNFWHTRKIKFLIGICFFMYVASFLLYPFKIALLSPILVGIAFAAFRRFKNSFIKLKVGYTLTFAVSFCFLISLVLLSNPSVAEINEKINNRVDAITENVTALLPEGIKDGLSSINETIRNNIKKIDKIEINLKNPLYR